MAFHQPPAAFIPFTETFRLPRTYDIRIYAGYHDEESMMIQMENSIAAVMEAKDRRKELKMQPSVHAAIEIAAKTVGMDSSTFIVSAAYRAARDVEASQARTVVAPELFDAFAAAVDRPGRRNEALEALFRRRRDILAGA